MRSVPLAREALEQADELFHLENRDIVLLANHITKKKSTNGEDVDHIVLSDEARIVPVKLGQRKR